MQERPRGAQRVRRRWARHHRCGGGGDGAGEPQTGGTLKVLSDGDTDRIDPQLIAYVPSNSITRVISRSLLSYEASNDAETRSKLVGDLATEVPKPTDDGLTYTITLRDGGTRDAPDGARSSRKTSSAASSASATRTSVPPWAATSSRSSTAWRSSATASPASPPRSVR